MGAKRAVLRKADECSQCARPVAVGATARWDATTREVTCLTCLEAATVTASPADAAGDEPVIDLTVVDLLRPRPELEPVTLLGPDLLSTPSRAHGGDRRVASVLADRLGDRAVLIHNRDVPRSRRPIDHLAVTAGGVWVIDTPALTGLVDQREVGGFFRSEVRLYVGGRDQTRLIDELAWQLGAVETAIGDPTVPVHGAVALVDADWSASNEPFSMADVWVSSPSALADLVDAPGTRSPADIDRVSARLWDGLPTA